MYARKLIKYSKMKIILYFYKIFKIILTFYLDKCYILLKSNQVNCFYT